MLNLWRFFSDSYILENILLILVFDFKIISKKI